MEKYLCLDIGDKRIGVAVSDPFLEYALPVKTINRVNLKKDLAEIIKLIGEKGASAIVCGLPVNFDGTPSVQTEKARFFIDRLKESFSGEIIAVDERCTTVEAEETLISQGKSREERKRFVDSLAAASILDGFLSDRKRKQIKKDNISGDSRKEKIMEDKKKVCDCCSEGHEHTKEEHCDCGCEDEDDIVELTTDDGKKLKFYFVGTIEYKGKNYSAFEPAEEIEGMSEDDLVIFELAEGDEEGADLLPIEDEKLLDEVFEEFCKALDEEEEYSEEEEEKN